MPNQNLKPDFRYLIRFLQGCHYAMYRILTWQPCKYSLDHISDTIHPILKFLFAKSTYFFMLNPIQTVKCPYLDVHIWSNECLQGCQVKIRTMAKWQPCKNRMRYRKSGFRFWFGMKKSVKTKIILVCYLIEFNFTLKITLKHSPKTHHFLHF